MRCPRVRACFRRLALRVPSLRVDLAVGDPAQFPAARDFAYTTDDARPIRVVINPALERESAERISGVLRHELAHALLMARGDSDHSERAADRLAEVAFGKRIRYDARLLVQTTDPYARWGRRPKTLPP